MDEWKKRKGRLDQWEEGEGVRMEDSGKNEAPTCQATGLPAHLHIQELNDLRGWLLPASTTPFQLKYLWVCCCLFSGHLIPGASASVLIHF
jgi:hypothetical protein